MVLLRWTTRGSGAHMLDDSWMVKIDFFLMIKVETLRALEIGKGKGCNPTKIHG